MTNLNQVLKIVFLIEKGKFKVFQRYLAIMLSLSIFSEHLSAMEVLYKNK